MVVYKLMGRIASIAGLIVSSLPAMADEMQQYALDKNKVSQLKDIAITMKYKAEIADSLGKMAEAGFIIDDDGMPIGIEGGVASLAAEVRKAAGESKRTQASAGHGQHQTLPWGNVSDGLPVPIYDEPVKKVASTGQADMHGFGNYILHEISVDSVTIIGNMGKQVLRVGESVDGYKLVRFDGESAYFNGNGISPVLTINWTN